LCFFVRGVSLELFNRRVAKGFDYYTNMGVIGIDAWTMFSGFFQKVNFYIGSIHINQNNAFGKAIYKFNIIYKIFLSK